jgi:hypothetical protein
LRLSRCLFKEKGYGKLRENRNHFEEPLKKQKILKNKKKSRRTKKMKATLIFATLILFTGLMGCSDNLSVIEPFDQFKTENDQQKNPGTDRYELIWKLDELRIKALSEGWVEDKAVYTLPPIVPPVQESNDYVITFDGYTNAGRFSNGFEAFAKVSWQNESNGAQSTVFEGAGTEGINGHKEIRVTNADFDEVRFSVTLFMVDGPTQKEHSNVATLKLSDISIYRRK